MVKIDILDIIEGLYNVENSNIFIENYLKSETMFGEENPVNKRVRAIKNTFSQYGENYPQNKCGNVENLFFEKLFKDSYENNMTNIDKGAVLQGLGGNIGAIEDLSNNSKNIVEKYIKSCETVVNTGATGGYMHNVVDKLFTNVKNQGVINNFDPMEENINEIQKVCSTEKDFIPQIVKNIGVTSPIFQSMEKSFIADDRSYIPQAMERNYTSSDNSSSININMGGITQNITGQNGEDILDILVEKLVKGINTGGESPR